MYYSQDCLEAAMGGPAYLMYSLRTPLRLG